MSKHTGKFERIPLTNQQTSLTNTEISKCIEKILKVITKFTFFDKCGTQYPTSVECKSKGKIKTCEN